MTNTWATKQCFQALQIHNHDDDVHQFFEFEDSVQTTLIPVADGELFMRYRFDSTADKSAIIMIHGAGLSSAIFQQALNHWEDFHVFCIDLRGHGESSEFTSTQLNNPDFDLFDCFADDLKTCIELTTAEFGITNTFLLGHSLGGAAVQNFLVKYKNEAQTLLKGAVLLSTLSSSKRMNWWGQESFGKFTPWINAPAKTLVKSTVKFTNRLSENGSHESKIAATMLRSSFGKNAPLGAIQACAFLGAYCPNETKTLVFSNLLEFCVLDDLYKINLPVLVIGGKRDLLTSAGMLKTMSSKFKRGKLALLDGIGHMLMYEDDALFRNQLRCFVELNLNIPVS